MPCRLQTLLSSYVACNEPLACAAEIEARDSEIGDNFLALQSSGIRLGTLLQEGAAKGVEEALGCPSDSDLSKPDPLPAQVQSQRRVREMGGNAGGLWT